jgi:hypothetical protein
VRVQSHPPAIWEGCLQGSGFAKQGPAKAEAGKCSERLGENVCCRGVVPLRGLLVLALRCYKHAHPAVRAAVCEGRVAMS